MTYPKAVRHAVAAHLDKCSLIGYSEKETCERGAAVKTIAIIEDDQTIGDLLEEVLQKEGYQVERAYSGTEAVYLLSRCRPDLALLDLMLPGLSGEEVLPHLAGVPVIVVKRQGGRGRQGEAAAGRGGGLPHQAL